MERFWSRDFVKLASANLLLAIPFYFMIAMMPLYIIEGWDATQREVGLAMSGFTFAAVVMRPFTGVLLDSFRRKSIYLIFLVLFAGAFFLYPITKGFALFILLRLLHGAAWGGVGTTGSTLIVDLAPHQHRGEAISIFGLSMTIAMAVGPSIGSATYDTLGSYEGLFIAGGAVAVVALLLGASAKVPHQKIETKGRRAFKWSSIFSKEALPAAFFILLAQIPYGVLMTYSPLYAQEFEGASAGGFFLALALGMFIARSMVGKVFDQKGPRLPILSGILTMVAGYILLAITHNSITFHLAAILVGLGAGSVTSIAQAIANAHVAPARRGAANSTYLTFHDSGIGLGALLFGWIIATVGYRYSFALLAVIALLALLLFFTYTYPCYKKNFMQDGKA